MQIDKGIPMPLKCLAGHQTIFAKKQNTNKALNTHPVGAKIITKKNASIIRRKSLSKVNRNNRKTKVSIQTLKKKMGHKQFRVKGGKMGNLSLPGDFGRHTGCNPNEHQ